jgi:hypothetical protein
MSIDDRLRSGLSRNGAAIQVAVEPELAVVTRRDHVIGRRRVAGVLIAATAVVALAPWALGEAERTPVPVAPGASDLVGTYVVDVPDGTAGGAAGRWEVTLEEGGALEVQPPSGYDDQMADRLTYAVEDGVIETNVFLDAPGCQLPGALVGEYTWERSGTTVRFVRVRDECMPRRALFDAVWKRQP